MSERRAWFEVISWPFADLLFTCLPPILLFIPRSRLALRNVRGPHVLYFIDRLVNKKQYQLISSVCQGEWMTQIQIKKADPLSEPVIASPAKSGKRRAAIPCNKPRSLRFPPNDNLYIGMWG
jgi:hypothetical protein